MELTWLVSFWLMSEHVMAPFGRVKLESSSDDGGDSDGSGDSGNDSSGSASSSSAASDSSSSSLSAADDALDKARRELILVSKWFTNIKWVVSVILASSFSMLCHITTVQSDFNLFCWRHLRNDDLRPHVKLSGIQLRSISGWGRTMAFRGGYLACHRIAFSTCAYQHTSHCCFPAFLSLNLHLWKLRHYRFFGRASNTTLFDIWLCQSCLVYVFLFFPLGTFCVNPCKYSFPPLSVP